MKDWTGNSKTTFAVLGASNHSDYERAEHDFYATDSRAIDELYKVIAAPKKVWECACGLGHLSEQMWKHGSIVISTDLIDRGYGIGEVDFLEADVLLAPVIVTNPPYRYAKEFVLHALELGAEMVCMFLKLTFLEGVNRQELFQKYPPRTVAVFTRRIQVARNGDPEMFKKSSAACYAWFIWEKGYTGRPEIVWINK